MTTEEAKIQIEYRKDFATPAQIEALDMGIKALNEVECYKQAIEKIKAEIDENIQDCLLPKIHDPRWGGRYEAFKESLEIIDRHIKGVKS